MPPFLPKYLLTIVYRIGMYALGRMLVAKHISQILVPYLRYQDYFLEENNTLTVFDMADAVEAAFPRIHHHFITGISKVCNIFYYLVVIQ